MAAGSQYEGITRLDAGLRGKHTMEGRAPDIPAPVVGDWYRRQGGELFEIVAIDEDDGTIEVQHFDGTVEELDFEAWDDQVAGCSSRSRRSTRRLDRTLSRCRA